MAQQLVSEFLDLLSKPFFRSDSLHDEHSAFSGHSTDVREPEKIEGLWSPLTPATAIFCREATELEQSRFVRMEYQSELLQAGLQFPPEAFRIVTMLETDDKVIRIAHDDDIAARMRIPPPVDPQVQYIVQEHIGEQW